MRKLNVTLFDSNGVECERREFDIDVDAVNGSEDEDTDDQEQAFKVAGFVTGFVLAMSGAGLGWSVTAERVDS